MWQHAQMLVVRKEGKAHDQYNKFRSAFELMEAVGCEPHDCFEETDDDLPPLERLERRMQHAINDLVVQIQTLEDRVEVQKEEIEALKKQIKDRR